MKTALFVVACLFLVLAAFQPAINARGKSIGWQWLAAACLVAALWIVNQ